MEEICRGPAPLGSHHTPQNRILQWLVLMGSIFVWLPHSRRGSRPGIDSGVARQQSPEGPSQTNLAALLCHHHNRFKSTSSRRFHPSPRLDRTGPAGTIWSQPRTRPNFLRVANSTSETNRQVEWLCNALKTFVAATFVSFPTIARFFAGSAETPQQDPRTSTWTLTFRQRSDRQGRSIRRAGSFRVAGSCAVKLSVHLGEGSKSSQQGDTPTAAAADVSTTAFA
jgi:hypothetical protein